MKRSSVRLLAFMFLFAAALVSLGGCGGSDKEKGGQSSHPKVYRYGELHGDLANNLLGAFPTMRPIEEADGDGMIIIALKDGEALSESVKQALLKAYGNNYPVAVEHATTDKVNLLLKALNRDPNFSLPPSLSKDLQYVDLYAIQKLPNGSLKTWTALNDDVPPRILFKDPSRDIMPKNSSADQEALDDKRVGNFIQWTKDDFKEKTSLSQEERAALSRAMGEQEDLAKLAVAEVHAYDTSLQKQTFQVFFMVYSCHSFTGNDDYFLVKQWANLNPSGLYRREKGSASWKKTVGTYVYGYTVRYEFENDFSQGQKTGNPLDMVLLQHNPPNVNNVKSFTSGMSWNLGGSIGFSGTTPTGSVSGGVSYSSSETVNIEDCSVENNSAPASAPSAAIWKYSFPHPTDGAKYFSWRDINDAVFLSRSNFQPAQFWIWKITPAARAKMTNNKSFSSKFRWTMGATIGGIGTFWGLSATERFELRSAENIFMVPLSLPPLITAENNRLEFKKDGETKTANILSQGAWTASSDQPWCAVDETSGPGSSSNQTLHITVQPDTTGQNRTAKISLQMEGYSIPAEITVSQSQF